MGKVVKKKYKGEIVQKRTAEDLTIEVLDNNNDKSTNTLPSRVSSRSSGVS